MALKLHSLQGPRTTSLPLLIHNKPNNFKVIPSVNATQERIIQGLINAAHFLSISPLIKAAIAYENETDKPTYPMYKTGG